MVNEVPLCFVDNYWTNTYAVNNSVVVLSFHVFRLRINLKHLIYSGLILNVSCPLFVGFMIINTMCTYDLPKVFYLPAHFIFFDFTKLVSEGRLQTKTTDVSSFISVTGHTSEWGSNSIPFRS